MAATRCCVPLCTNDSRYKKEISFHAFPKEAKRRAEWIARIRRDPGPNFEIKKHTAVCSEHFEKTDYRRSLAGQRRLLKSTAVPSLFAWTKRKEQEISRRILKRKSSEIPPTFQLNTKEQVTNPAFTSTPNLYDHDYGVVRQEVSLEEMLQAARKEIERLEQELDRKNNISQFGLRRFMYDDEMIRFYTGFSSSNVLWSFIDVIKPSAEKMRTWSQVQRGRAKKPGEGIINEVFINMKKQSLAIEDQLFMWLCKVKLGLFDQDLAVRFNVSISTVSRMIITWSNFLYFTMGCLPLWSSRSQIRKTMPSSFKDSFSNVRVIIDCTEMKVQTPSSLVLHSEFYSSYKSATTFKGLVGITPSGAVSFISKLYTGSISDREIVKRCGILRLLEDGDGVMADKGFTIEDLLSPLNCSLNIPPFLSEKVQFSKEDVERTQKIAKLRIHVERAIGRVKENHLFDAVIPLSLASSINQIWSVCCMLSNFKGPLF